MDPNRAIYSKSGSESSRRELRKERGFRVFYRVMVWVDGLLHGLLA